MQKFTLSAALLALALPATAEDTALLLGVARYSELSRVSGADDMERSVDALTDAGFEVQSALNPTGAAMLPRLNRFMNFAADGDRVIAALSGRFYTSGVQTWMLAADANRPAPFGMGNTALSVDLVLQILGQAPGQALLVLGVDGRDDDPIGTLLREGLGDLQIPQGVTVVVTAPSGVDDVLNLAAKPGGDVIAYVRDSRRVQSLGYQPRSLVFQSDEVAVAAAPRPTVDPSLRFWNDAQEANTEDSYRDFVLNYPTSRYAVEARRRLDALESDPIRRAERIEDALSLNRNARRAVQRNLTLLGYNTRGVDGIFGPGSRGAVRNWQQSNGFEQTSFLTREQISRIDAQATRRQAELDAEKEREREEALRLDRAFWDETGAKGDVVGYRTYLERYPNGVFAAQAKQELAALTGDDDRAEQPQQNAPQNDQARQQERRLNINPILARLIESRLAQLGFNPGQVDGRFDSDTRGAIARYQTRRNLPATGYLSEPTLARLLADTF